MLVLAIIFFVALCVHHEIIDVVFIIFSYGVSHQSTCHIQAYVDTSISETTCDCSVVAMQACKRGSDKFCRRLQRNS